MAEIVSVAFEIVPNKIAVVAVGDEPDAFRKKGIFYFYLFEPDRPLLSRNFRQPGQLVDEIALTHSTKRKGEFGPERQAIEDRRKRKAYQCGCEGAAKDDDGRMDVEEHPQIAAHQNERGKDDGPRQQA